MQGNRRMYSAERQHTLGVRPSSQNAQANKSRQGLGPAGDKGTEDQLLNNSGS